MSATIHTMSGSMWMPTQAPTLSNLLRWHVQPFPVLPALAFLLAVLYLAAVWQLHRTGTRWPFQRTIWWMLGVATLVLMTATGLDGYGMQLFSVHMVQHMTLSMFSPVLLALGAPMTLLLRVLRARHGGGWSLRRGLLTLLHSRFARFLTHPGITTSLFLMSLYGLYFTPVFDFLMGSMWGHNLMLVHFLLVGMLYFWGIMGVDPSPRQAGRGVRRLAAPVLAILELFITVPFHAFFGVIVMMSVAPIVGFYAHPVPGWNISPLADQAMGGGIAWGFTELPTLLVLGALFMRWQSSATRRDRFADRKAANNGDAERLAYNEYLAAIAARDVRGSVASTSPTVSTVESP
ncbi:cytochrome c oxidase assembly protein [Cryobacterium sp. PH31-AA6]|uniref:cytochrome c oxidase assembly protein n=1 Tax=Cryobacterium sp. PH31-AA6 TaxID=3046205 RepID=UPI0024BB9D42|nr:cytochrome c oxidase assembly protein [Cryobacterium sp. PH31-AA6]MDJ0322705.1 cytochrome c oxidase assembly protein [Cryobacterium sp. PH31-AA6]